MKRLILIGATLGLLALVPARATADLLILNYSGTFSADTTLGGTPLGAETPFTFAATFDSATDESPTEGQGLFPAVSVTFDITGFGTFASAPGADLQVELWDPSGTGTYIAGLARSNGVQFRAFFSTANPPFDADDPSPSLLSDFTNSVNFGLTTPLAGTAGDLVAGITSFGQTATITASAVPEPSSFTLLGIAALGSVGLAAARRRRRVSGRINGVCSAL